MRVFFMMSVQSHCPIFHEDSSLTKMLLFWLLRKQLSATVFDSVRLLSIVVMGGCDVSTIHHKMFHRVDIPTSFIFRQLSCPCTNWVIFVCSILRQSKTILNLKYLS